MFIENWARPGVASGLYPEKQKKHEGWLDGTWRWLVQHRGPQSLLPPPEAYRFLEQVTRLKEEFRGLTEKEIRKEARGFRSPLHRQGFQSYYVARSFALVVEWFARNENVSPGDSEVLAGWGLIHQRAVESGEANDNAVSIALAAITAALAGLPVHVITATDYLVRRHASRLSRICGTLGVSVGQVVAGMDVPARQEQYRADITFTTHKQVAFDYLRDHLASEGRRSRLHLHLGRLNGAEDRERSLVLRGLCFGIIDDLDTVLIDDARAPLLISRNTDLPGARQVYEKALELSALLHAGMDFEIDNMRNHVRLTSSGRIHVAQITESLGGMWSGMERSQDLITQALTAVHLLVRDRHYRVSGERIHAEERALRALQIQPSWQRGLFQLLELKEGLPSSGGRETLAKISYQELFQRYLHLGGISHTLVGARKELEKTYPLKVMRIGNRDGIKRRAGCFRLYPDAEKKWEGVVGRVQALHRSGRPVIIGLRSLPMAELLASMLAKRGLPHQVIAGMQEEDEAHRLETAGRPGSITLLLYHAGKGMRAAVHADKAVHAGAHGILAEVSECRRHDRKLIQRCEAGQAEGDYDYFLSLEDEVVRMFAPAWAVTAVRGFGWMGGWARHMFLNLTQRQVERQHAVSRAKLMDTDKQAGKMLAFSGRAE
ncbi:preprotein translocase subunit SecA [Nitrospina gracilis]|uniref:preprotein translocase subunit SecA n=1 Tax=Nitrospina gracilis TaxID=35801 RepID=UPI001F3516FA|nr:hypothetical protein [Nitrospina gracilis]MCF8721415.1 preprotein translocase subunit SecA [Nitrospina gracilis Nb-211]